MFPSNWSWFVASPLIHLVSLPHSLKWSKFAISFCFLQDYGDGESSDGASYDGEDMLSSSPAKKSNGAYICFVPVK